MQRKCRDLSLVLTIILATLAASGAATASGPTPSQMLSGGLLMRAAGGYENAPLLNTDVSITVNGLVARVSVMQEFRNEGSDWVEGVYVFPLPEGAAVDHMRLYIGDRFIEGEIREKEQARNEYEAAKQAGKKTSLVEQQRANLFTTSVANIAPGETVIVEIEYLEDVRFEEGTFSIRFPMTVTPRFNPGDPLSERKGNGWSPDTMLVDDASLISPPMVATSQGHKASIHVSINSGMPLEIIASRYHPVNVAEAGGRYLVSLAAMRAPLDCDFELLWRPVPSSSPRAMMFAETIGGQPHYLLMVMPPETDTAALVRVPREMIFIIDTSGSMHGVSIEQAKQALLRALDGLQPDDRFNIIEFNTFTTALYAKSVEANYANISTAQNFVRLLQSNGGTNMRPALEQALAMPSSLSHLRQIVFITDGAVGNEEGLFKLIDSRLGDARLFTVGIGSAPNSWFMRKAAESGRGTFTIISALHEVGEKMDRLFRKLERPQVTDIDVMWPSGVIVESYPSIVPDLYSGEPVAVRAKASSEFRPGDVVYISGASIAGGWASDIPVVTREQSPGVGTLWARAKIADLHDKARRGADPDATRAAVVETALAHHLVSKFTSLVAIDKTPVRVNGEPLTSGQVPSLMPHGQTIASAVGFPATATIAPWLIRSGLVTLLAALLLLAAPAIRGALAHGLAN